MARLKIATFNINGVRARQDALLAWLEREQPDVACLQELKAPDEAFPQRAVEALGYGAIWHGQKSWNGVAILARGAQPEERRRGLPGDPDPSQSRYLEADVHGLRVACLYLPNGNPWPGPKFDYKLAWFAQLHRHAARLLKDGVPTVLCGDFNVVPTDELDIYDPKSWRNDALLQPESREAYFALLEQGWTDSIRQVHGDAKIFTFWDYFRRHWERDAGLRIDHLLLSPQLAPMLRDAGVDRWVRGQPGASDHAPTWVVLDSTDGAKPKRGASSKTATDKATAGKATTKRLLPSTNASKTQAGTSPAVAGKRTVTRTAAGKTAAKKSPARKTATKTAAKKASRTRAAAAKTTTAGARGTRSAKKG
ncbi:MAG TPA: exodeoxyribonuclease III [Lysobacter sp.]